jgi:hypothetical protein
MRRGHVDGETGAVTPDDEAKCHGKVTRKPQGDGPGGGGGRVGG